MTMQLDSVVPFGRSLDEYRKMFLLTDEDLQLRILGAGDGPASFNAELSSLGGKVVSVDPLYQFDANEIHRRFEEVLPGIINQVRATPEDWVWSYHGSPDGLQSNRIRVAKRFVDDFARNKGSPRYVEGELPSLRFPDGEFDLALCSHFLFLYSDHFDSAFHLTSILELLRVANEVRIFPLLTLMLRPSQHLPHIINELQTKGYVVDIHTVGYELQKGGNQMMSIKKQANKAIQADAFGAADL
jgi:hypothetical protein